MLFSFLTAAPLHAASSDLTVASPSAVPPAISPNGDGAFDATTISASFRVPGKWGLAVDSEKALAESQRAPFFLDVTVTVAQAFQPVPPGPARVLTLRLTVSPVLRPKGTAADAFSLHVPFAVAWDGKSAAGVVVADGVYVVSITGVLKRGPNGANTGEQVLANTASADAATVLVDTTPPTFANPSPPSGGFTLSRRPSVSIAWTDGGAGIDSASGSLTLTESPSSPPNPESPSSGPPFGPRIEGTATVSVAGATFIPSADLAGGGYAASAAVSDAVGNRATLTWTFRVAEAGTTIGASGGNVTVTNPASPVVGATVSVPPGALPEGSVVTIEAPAPVPFEVAGYAAAGPQPVFTPGGVTFSAPIAISVPYDPAQVRGDPQRTLALYQIEDASGVWTLIPHDEIVAPTSVGAPGLVVARVLHFSHFQAAEHVVDPAASTVALTPDRVPADGTTPISCVVTPKDSAGALIGPGQEVSLTAVAQAFQPVPAGVQDLGDGTYLAVLTSPVGGAFTTTATVNGVTLAAQPVAHFKPTLDAIVSAGGIGISPEAPSSPPPSGGRIEGPLRLGRTASLSAVGTGFDTSDATRNVFEFLMGGGGAGVPPAPGGGGDLGGIGGGDGGSGSGGGGTPGDMVVGASGSGETVRAVEGSPAANRASVLGRVPVDTPTTVIAVRLTVNGEPSDPVALSVSAASSLERVSGDAQSGPIGEAAPAPLVVRLVGPPLAGGLGPVPNEPVTFAIVKGGTFLGDGKQSTAYTDADGLATSPFLNLAGGENIVTATSVGFATTFVLTGGSTSILQHIPLAGASSGLAFERACLCPGTNRLFVMHVALPKISILDPETNTVVGEILLPGPALPLAIAALPDGSRIVVTRRETGYQDPQTGEKIVVPPNVTLVDPAMGAVDGEIALPLGFLPAALLTSPIGPSAIVFTGGPGSPKPPPGGGATGPIAVVDLASRTLRAFVSTPDGSLLTSLALSPDGATAWIGTVAPNTGAATLRSLDVAALSLDVGVSIGNRQIDGIGVVSPDGGRLYVPRPIAQTVAVFSLPERSLLAEIPFPGRDLNFVLIAITHDGKRLLVPGRNVGSVAVADTDPASARYHALLGLRPLGFVTSQVAVTADDRFAYASLPGADEIVRFPLDAALEMPPELIALGVMPERLAVFEGPAYGSGRIWVTGRIDDPVSRTTVSALKQVDAASGEILRTLVMGSSDGQGGSAPKVSSMVGLQATGEVVVVTQGKDQTGSAFRFFDAATGEEHPAQAFAGFIQAVEASPDGSRLYMVESTADGRFVLQSWDAASRTVDVWGDMEAFPQFITTSREGDRLYAQTVFFPPPPSKNPPETRLEVWDTTSGQRIETRPFAEWYQQLAILPGGTRAYGIRSDAHLPGGLELALVDLATGSVLETIPGVSGWRLRRMPDARRLAVLVRGERGEALAIVDIEEGSPTRHTVLRSLEISGSPQDLGFLSDGSKAFVTVNTTVQALLVLDLTAPGGAGGAGVPPAPAGPIAAFRLGAIMAPGYEGAFTPGPPPVVRGGAPFTIVPRGVDADGRLAESWSGVVTLGVATDPDNPALEGQSGLLDGALLRVEPAQRAALVLPGLAFGVPAAVPSSPPEAGVSRDGPVTLTVAQAFQPVPPGPVTGSVTVFVDNTPPSPAVITAPASGLATPNYLVRLEGTTEPNATLEIFDEFEGYNSLVGTAVAADTGAFAYDLTLPQGAHTITAVATDAVGNVGQASSPALTVTVRLDPPVLTSPADGFVTNAFILTVEGTTTPNGFVLIFDCDPECAAEAAQGGGAHPVQVGFAIADDTGHFTAGLFLQDGLHSLTAAATDPMGNRSEPSSPALTGLIDRDPPSLSFFGLENGTRLGTRTPAIFVTLSDAASGIDPATVTLSAFGLADWTSLDLTPYLQFSQLPPEEGPGVRGTAVLPEGVLLPEGEVNLTLSGRDLAGNESGASVGIVIDDTPPEVLSILPADQDLLADFANATIRMEYADGPTFFAAGVSPASVRIVLNGQDVTWMFTITDTEAVFENANNLALADVVTEGANAVTISVADQVGNLASATTTWAVHVDWIAVNPYQLVTDQINARWAFFGGDPIPPIGNLSEMRQALDDLIPRFLDPETGDPWDGATARRRNLGHPDWNLSWSWEYTIQNVLDGMIVTDSLVYVAAQLNVRALARWQGESGESLEDGGGHGFPDDRLYPLVDYNDPVWEEGVGALGMGPLVIVTAGHTEWSNYDTHFTEYEADAILHSRGRSLGQTRYFFEVCQSDLTPDPTHPVTGGRFFFPPGGSLSDVGTSGPNTVTGKLGRGSETLEVTTFAVGSETFAGDLSPYVDGSGFETVPGPTAGPGGISEGDGQVDVPVSDTGCTMWRVGLPPGVSDTILQAALGGTAGTPPAGEDDGTQYHLPPECERVDLPIPGGLTLIPTRVCGVDYSVLVNLGQTRFVYRIPDGTVPPPPPPPPDPTVPPPPPPSPIEGIAPGFLIVVLMSTHGSEGVDVLGKEIVAAWDKEGDVTARGKLAQFTGMVFTPLMNSDGNILSNVGYGPSKVEAIDATSWTVKQKAHFRAPAPGEYDVKVTGVGPKGENLEDFAKLWFVRATLLSVMFTSDHGVMLDNDTDYSANGNPISEPEWQEGVPPMAPRNFPISQTKGTPVGAQVRVRIEPSSFPLEETEITGTTAAPLTSFQMLAIPFSAEDTGYPMQSTGSLPSEIDTLSVSIDWTLRFGHFPGSAVKQGQFGLGTSGTHEMFATWAAPLSTLGSVTQPTTNRVRRAAEVLDAGNVVHPRTPPIAGESSIAIVGRDFVRAHTHFVAPCRSEPNPWEDVLGPLAPGVTAASDCDTAGKLESILLSQVGVVAFVDRAFAYSTILSSAGPGTPLTWTDTASVVHAVSRGQGHATGVPGPGDGPESMVRLLPDGTQRLDSLGFRAGTTSTYINDFEGCVRVDNGSGAVAAIQWYTIYPPGGPYASRRAVIQASATTEVWYYDDPEDAQRAANGQAPVNGNPPGRVADPDFAPFAPP